MAMPFEIEAFFKSRLLCSYSLAQALRQARHLEPATSRSRPHLHSGLFTFRLPLAQDFFGQQFRAVDAIAGEHPR